MQLSMWMLADRLVALSPKTFIQAGGRVLRNARLLADSQEHARTTLYLQYNNTNTIMCMNGNDLIVVNSDDIDQVLNDMLDVFDHINEWSDAADELIRKGCTLEELLVHAAAEAKMYLIVADATYYIHAYAAWGAPLTTPLATPLLNSRSMDIESILKVDALPMVRSADAGIYYVPIPAYNSTSPVGNIFVDGVHQGWLIGIRDNDQFSEGDLDTLDIVLQKVEAWMAFNQAPEAHHEQAGVLARMLEDTPVKDAEIQRALDTFMWRVSDTFRVYAVQSKQGEGEGEAAPGARTRTEGAGSGSARTRMEAAGTPGARKETSSHFVAQRFLSQLSKNTFVIPLKENFAIVVNESLGVPADYDENMQEILARCGYAAGKGPVFRDISLLRFEYQAASVAASYAQVGQVIGFEQVKLDYALALVRKHAVCDVRHGALDALAAYDKAHDTQLLPTLEAFVRNRGSYVETYSELFIHRSTLTYRLERIADITQLDFADEKTWNHLALSFLL